MRHLLATKEMRSHSHAPNLEQETMFYIFFPTSRPQLDHKGGSDFLSYHSCLIHQSKFQLIDGSAPTRQVEDRTSETEKHVMKRTKARLRVKGLKRSTNEIVTKIIKSSILMRKSTDLRAFPEFSGASIRFGFHLLRNFNLHKSILLCCISKNLINFVILI